jgi:hypothetical protein
MKTFFGVFAAAVVGVALMSSAALGEEAPATGAAPSTPPATTTPAPTPTDNAAQTQTQAQEGDDKIVCKKEPPPVGSRVGARKICRTVAEWRRIASVARETTGEIQNRRVEPEGK